MTISGVSEEEKERMLHCVVIGGGPTGVEFSGELSDFIVRDVCQRYAHVKNYVRVTLIEVIYFRCFIYVNLVYCFTTICLVLSLQANEILSSFDVGLRQYAKKHLSKVQLYRTTMDFSLI